MNASCSFTRTRRAYEGLRSRLKVLGACQVLVNSGCSERCLRPPRASGKSVRMDRDRRAPSCTVRVKIVPLATTETKKIGRQNPPSVPRSFMFHYGSGLRIAGGRVSVRPTHVYECPLW